MKDSEGGAVLIFILIDRPLLALRYFLSLLNMASSQDRALQALSSELAWLDRQITALLKRQEELLRQKSQ
ncbi:hypothetical protein SRHO_G00254530 [Serrasalmus rhombeus]